MATPDNGTSDASRHEWLLEAVQDVIVLAMDRKVDAVCARLEQIGQRGGHVAMFSACWAWASAAGQLSGLTDAVRNAGNGAIAAMTTLTGRPVRDDHPATFAGKMLTCAINGDVATGHALFDASCESDDADRHHRDVVAVVAMVADLGRLKEAEDGGRWR